MKRREFVTLLGGVATRGASAATAPGAARRRAHERGRRRSGSARPQRGVPVKSAGIWLDRGPQPADRPSLGRGRCRPPSPRRGRIARSRSRRRPGLGHLDSGAVAKSDPHRADRVRGGRRPDRRLLRRQHGAPGGNTTGFISFEYGLSGKWLELLKQIAPGVTRVAVLRDPRHIRRDRPVRRNPVRGAVARR